MSRAEHYIAIVAKQTTYFSGFVIVIYREIFWSSALMLNSLEVAANRASAALILQHRHAICIGKTKPSFTLIPAKLASISLSSFATIVKLCWVILTANNTGIRPYLSVVSRIMLTGNVAGLTLPKFYSPV